MRFVAPAAVAAILIAVIFFGSGLLLREALGIPDRDRVTLSGALGVWKARQN